MHYARHVWQKTGLGVWAAWCCGAMLWCGMPLLNAAEGTTYDDPAKVDADYAIQGEYLGEKADGSGKLGVQVLARGNGKFHAVGYDGGLPGEGWDRGDTKHETDGELKNGEVVFAAGEHRAVLKDGGITITGSAGEVEATLKKVTRESPTAGAKPPAGAVVLFDGKNAAAFPGAKVTDDHLLIQGATSKQTFGDCTLHVEFRTPYQPHHDSQARGNSGVYLQGRYEVQVLDSFGLEGKNNECGGIYGISDPAVNMCYPPLTWQTYDIEYTAAKFEGDKKVKNARMTVKHNGVVVQDNVEIPHGTTAAPVAEAATPGPLYLQDHGNPVRYRNIWLLEKK
ncbi:MAG: DUF1080 domain-containing protein [Pirellulales bacterium]|nr:DUF1080 domain-containing protein [Pirellulales bacterium]